MLVSKFCFIGAKWKDAEKIMPGAPRSLPACLPSPKKREKITPGQTAKTSELCMLPSGQRARGTRTPDKLAGGSEVSTRSEHWMELFLR